MERRPAITRALVAGLDVLAVALLVLSAAAFHTGGFVVRMASARISFRTPSHVLMWLGAAVLLRAILDRHTGFLGRSREQWSRTRRRIQAEPLLVQTSGGGWRHAAYAGVGIAAALAVLMHQQLRQPYAVADLGDPLFSIWRMGWVTHQIVTDPLHLFDGNIFYPQKLALTLSDPIILPALTAAPLLAIGVHPVIAYNLLLFSGFWLSGIATYLLVERITGSARGAFIAGLMYACYSYRFEHYGHLELQMTQWMPLALLALHLFVSTGRWRYAIAFGLAGTAQLYSSMYYAVFFLVYATAIGAGLVLVERPSLRRLAPPLAVAGVLAIVIAIPITRAFTAAQPLKGERGIEEITYYSAKPSDYLRAQKSSALWRGVMLPPEPERALFPGAAPLVLTAIALAPPLGAMRLVYAAGLLVAFDGSLGFNGLSYPYLHRWFAPIRGIRSPARFAAIVGLTLSILAGFASRRALAWCTSPIAQRAMFAGLVAFVMIDAWPALTLSPVWKEPPSIYQQLKYMPGAVLAEFPVPDDEIGNVPFMYFSLWHWVPMVNGYSGFIPTSYADLHKEIRTFPSDEAVAALRRRGVNHITINCGFNSSGCDDLADRMRHSPKLRMTEESRWLGRRVQLYQIATQ